MRHRLFPVPLLAAATLMLLSGTAHAQTTAVGPYYATPSWDQTIACTTTASCLRFVVLSNFNNEAVLDRETGLVWERTPNPTLKTTIVGAFGTCLQTGTGGRFGWRLPTAPEFGSLLETKDLGFIKVGQLPAGHPFGVGTLTSVFWSSTRPLLGASDDFGEEVEFFSNGNVIINPQQKDFQNRVWCVRSANST